MRIDRKKRKAEGHEEDGERHDEAWSKLPIVLELESQIE